MSTKFTKRGTPLVESRTLQLIQNAGQLNHAVVTHVSQRLKAKGHESITPSLLSFLGALECGANYGSEIARNLGVTRQMVAKTVKELCRLGYLEQADDIGRQKKILFTEKGELLMADARLLLSEMDDVLLAHSSSRKLSTLSEELKQIAAVIDGAAGA